MFFDENAENWDMAKVRHINCGIFLRLIQLS